MNSIIPSDFPYNWCTCGEDKFGIWIDVKIINQIQRMRWIKPGDFLMGSPDDEPYRYDYETQHEVTLSKGFWIADSTCTQGTWQSIMNSNPSKNIGAQNPIENISWHDCDKFIIKLNSLFKKLSFALPTEAQWEYACRAGTQTPFSFGINILPNQVNYNGEHPYLGQEKQLYRKKTIAIKSLPANQWGLFEMHGNVWEWCNDWFDNHPKGGIIDPVGPSEGSYKILRGGSAFSGAADCRSAARIKFHPDNNYYRHGFRIIGIPKEHKKEEIYQEQEYSDIPQDEKENRTIIIEPEIVAKNINSDIENK